MPSQVISQIISFQIPPQNNLEILAQESRQNLDRDERCTILNKFPPDPLYKAIFKFFLKLHHQSEEIILFRITDFGPSPIYCFTLKIIR